MFEQFKAKAEAVSAEVRRFATKSEGVESILCFLNSEGLADAPGLFALWLGSPILKEMEPGVLQNIPGLKFEISRELAAEAKFGISQMDWGLADTGSLAHDSTRIEARLVSSLPDIHIAILPTKAILPDMPTLLEKIDTEKCSYLATITGPSRTADIERVLTIGVHGPSRLIIVCIDDLEGEK